MAQNLVPLFLDKDSGDIVATKRNNPGGGSGNRGGYEHLQATPSLVWLIPHNLTTKRLIVQVYDTTDAQVYADEVKLLDDDTVRITFNAPQAGSAKIVFF